MTSEEKLNALYKIRDKLHPITAVLIVGFVESQAGVLKEHDKKYIEEVYPIYFK